MIEVSLPGADLVNQGLADAAQGRLTQPALLVYIGSPRLRELGVDVPAPPPAGLSPELALYLSLRVDADPADAHRRYNAYIRRLVSCERALELEWARR